MQQTIQKTNLSNVFRFSKKSYDEAMSLLVFARDYFNNKGRIDKLNLSGEESIIYTIAMSTITTQLTSALSWLLMCRALENGEIGIEELKNDDLKMPEFELGLDSGDSCFVVLNDTVKELLAKSSNMYNRMKRMENTIYKMLEAEKVTETVN